MIEEYTKESIDYLKNTDIKKRKKLGQYFTPKSIRELLLSKLPKKDNADILDPACGSGEFLLSCKKYFKNPILYGFDIDKKLINISSKLVKNAIIKNFDFLNIDINKKKYDYIIGNPPYFELKLNEEIKKKYFDIIKGRVNIFSLFIKTGLDLLKDGGYLAYVVPPSMNNGAYFSKLREYVIKNSSLEYLHIIDGADNFHLANQKVMLIILKKTNSKKSSKYIFKKNGITIFTEDKKFLNKAYKNTVSLKDIGYTVKTGNIIWNEHKEKLTNDKNNSTLLIWASNINNGKIIIGYTKGKPQYIKNISNDLIIKSRVVVVNRITGSSKDINIKAAIVNEKEFVCENHINVIYMSKNANCNYSLEDIFKALQDKTNIKVMRLISGNTQISKTELERLLPIIKK
ncbi:methyltransferase domain-containing protein [Brachyspira aalborgi]|uniref:site-specific DNA-methyltransferase (adenine-specific) n=1 Tax=Brachyspira aalborgi TaxID=29522 RepID=A0AB38Q5G0_9SPIR|nr:N-6 DNA methylase [Brachyspira aalborgi]TXJ17098.1 methyltransferase domain-containing protein [Brachyspira aalborgi]TXJ22444.1 methyltransferase domain-containing protein [Brachyspira aalborgi]TXJ28689.1 methyltransferase domain-containing protein [Brachyspira aalborgi]TXJ34648.1 methyltransferase domain-containing protein [Brachyspira aalborgi]TXJ46108.1 methyltransferase domain-containing protein [Brachyspira aalborgi]